MKSKTTRRILATATAAAALVLTSCGSSANPSSETAGAEGELTAVTISIPPSVFAAPMHLGLSEGIFEKHGFDVTLQPGTSMAEMMPLLMNGESQYIFADLHNTVIAKEEGMPIAVGAPNGVNAQTEPQEKGFANLMVAEDSGIDQLKDLEGKKIGTNSINGQAQLDNMSYLESKGVDVSDIQWIAVPTQQAVAGLKQGQYDAITIAEPGGSGALLGGGVKLIGSADAAIPGAPMFVLAAQESYLQEDPERASRFQQAMIEANKLTNTDREAVEKSLGSFMDLPEEVIAATVLPGFSEAPFEAASAEPVIERLKAQGILPQDSTPDLDALFPVK
ncbi:ABC transporter substrate-binding protein [Glutamicibacter sp. MNS18]|uniref:ABC transporter substrate-binding protein n=1 Tax=Glutamicibacter sp. MNS18 TaxID=2989817 RepID=UPI00223583FE|nr:ABC transporter substrate-binding protein [Glutamicibacter sp. MNS18]MCW4466938.1 ABC transporter substrate-binding protein [Glutamicibacter sp. MNS18]